MHHYSGGKLWMKPPSTLTNANTPPLHNKLAGDICDVVFGPGYQRGYRGALTTDT